jgi:hypothetical protein
LFSKDLDVLGTLDFNDGFQGSVAWSLSGQVFLGFFFGLFFLGLVLVYPQKEEVDRYWIFVIWFFRDLDNFLGRFLDTGQIDAISINF